jgi:hypothetical protein
LEIESAEEFDGFLGEDFALGVGGAGPAVRHLDYG